MNENPFQGRDLNDHVGLRIGIANKPLNVPLSEDEKKLLDEALNNLLTQIPSLRRLLGHDFVVLYLTASDASKEVERVFEHFINEADSKLSIELGDVTVRPEPNPVPFESSIDFFPWATKR